MLITQVFLHFLLDFPLQGDFLATWKSKSPYVMFVHCFIWTFPIYIAGCVLGHYLDKGIIFNIAVCVWLMGGHYLMDSWKALRMYESRGWSDMKAFYFDQSFHFFQLFVAWAVSVVC